VRPTAASIQIVPTRLGRAPRSAPNCAQHLFEDRIDVCRCKFFFFLRQFTSLAQLQRMPPKPAVQRRSRGAAADDDAHDTTIDDQQTPDVLSCNAYSEKKVVRCGKPVAKPGDFCKSHQFWDRREHLRSGCALPEDSLKWHNVCAKIGCDLEGIAEGCEACPWLWHMECVDAFATIINVAAAGEPDNLESRLICGHCHRDAALFSLLPSNIRSPKSGKKDPKAGDDTEVDKFLNGEGRLPDDAPTDKDDGSLNDGAIVDLDTVSVADLESLLAKRRREATADADAQGAPKTPKASDDILEATRLRALALKTIGCTHLYAHKDAACNDPACPINKRDGSLDLSGGDRIDGKYTSFLLALLGPNRYRAFLPTQFAAVDAEIAELKCGKKDFERPTYSKQLLSDHQVVTHGGISTTKPSRTRTSAAPTPVSFRLSFARRVSI
jgi:hypothetical protein